jgi:tripartite ATP-independent transporter DctM subunit
MTWAIPLSAALALLVGLLFIGTPIFIGFLVINVIGVLYYFGPSGFGLFANSMFTTATNSALGAVPLFIVMGELLFRSGAMEVIFGSLDRLIGRIRGRQYVLCVLLSAILGALSGAAMAVAGLLGRSLFPSMIKRGYDVRLSAGTILGGASLDPIIPPSVLAVIIASLAEVSTGKLLTAGVGPGLMLTGMFLVYVLAKVWFNPALAPDLSKDLPDRNAPVSALMALVQMLPACFIFFLVMGLVILGIATPTEAAAAGAFGAFVLAYFYGGLSVDMLLACFKSAVKVSALLLLVMCSAVMFSQLLTFGGAPRALGQLVVEMNLSSSAMVFAMLLVPIVLHFMFLDQIAIMFILIPIYKPIIALYGIDPIWFWTMFLVVETVCAIWPPFGYTLFAMKTAVPDVPMSVIFSASWPFVWIICLGTVVMWLFPRTVTFLPELMGP